MRTNLGSGPGASPVWPAQTEPLWEKQCSQLPDRLQVKLSSLGVQCILGPQKTKQNPTTRLFLFLPPWSVETKLCLYCFVLTWLWHKPYSQSWKPQIPDPAYKSYLWYLTHCQQIPEHCGSQTTTNKSQSPSNDFIFILCCWWCFALCYDH